MRKLNLLLTVTRSLIYILKSNGPRIEPCGTPDFTSMCSDSKALNFTYCFQSVK